VGCTQNVFLVKKRLENLASYVRCPRSYKKHTQQYWETDIIEIIENRAKHIPVCQQPAPAVLGTVNVDKMTVEEIKTC
jgi:hypothetical protein